MSDKVPYKKHLQFLTHVEGCTLSEWKDTELTPRLVNYESHTHSAPLAIAVCHSRYDSLWWLLDHGADPTRAGENISYSAFVYMDNDQFKMYISRLTYRQVNERRLVDSVLHVHYCERENVFHNVDTKFRYLLEAGASICDSVRGDTCIPSWAILLQSEVHARRRRYHSAALGLLYVLKCRRRVHIENVYLMAMARELAPQWRGK